MELSDHLCCFCKKRVYYLGKEDGIQKVGGGQPSETQIHIETTFSIYHCPRCDKILKKSDLLIQTA